MCKITVFTPTYNRARTLRIAFESLMNQTNHNFIWLIIDDGSTDNTSELIDEFKEKALFEIRYYWKENGGRHTAVNYSYQFLNTEYVITLDSDDELVPDAIEKILKIWESIPKEKYDKYWCISGREIYASNGLMVGKPYPPNINDLSGRAQRKALFKCPGEKHCCRKVAIHIQYPFPIFPDTKFVTENMVWEKINRRYDQYCVNDIFGIYHTNSEDSLSTNSPHKRTKYRSSYYRSIFYINELFDEIFFNRGVIRCMVDLPRCAMKTDTPYAEVMKQLNSTLKKILVTLCYPVAWIFITFFHK